MIHPTAEVEEGATVHETARIWRFTHIRQGAVIGPEVSIGGWCFIDAGVVIPRGCKIQNYVQLCRGIELSEEVFLGPFVCFTNDCYPRAFPNGWQIRPTFVGHGASIGASAVIKPGVTIGPYAMVGAGSVVTKDIPEYGIVYGNPASLRGYCQKDGTPWETGA